MYSDMVNEQTIVGKDLDACKDILYKKYNTGYTITDYNTVVKSNFLTSFLGIAPRSYVKAKYIVKERSAPPPRPTAAQLPSTNQAAGADVRQGGGAGGGFTASQKELLTKQLTEGALTTFMQTARITKKIEELGKKIDSLSQENVKKEEHETIIKVDQLLEQNEFTAGYIARMNERMRNEFSLEDLEDFAAVQERVAEWIGEDIAIADKFQGKDPHVIVIVGPTGVGKTTTIAKMAAKVQVYAKRQGLPKSQWPVIHLITIDNIRVAAFQQIERYAESLNNNVSVEQVNSKEDLEGLFQLYNSPAVKYIFIDTSGISPNDFEHIATMRKVLDVPKMHADIYLAVSASTKPRDLERIIRNYEPFGFRSVIITKCDETSSYGNVLSVLCEKGKSISMITTNQDVMNGHEKASAYYFLKRLDGFELDDERIRQRFGGNHGSGEEKTAED